MNAEQKIQYVTAELFEKGNSGIITEVFDTDYIAHDGDKIHKGQIFIEQYLKKLRTAVPDIAVGKIEFLCREKETLTWQRTFTGTHKANMLGIPASGKKLFWHEMVVTRFKEGRIIEEWIVSDLAARMMINLKK